MKRILGLDLGQSNDFTAITIIELPNSNAVNVTYLERIRQQPYPIIVDRVRKLTKALRAQQPCDLVVDATGVGRAVTDLLADLNPVKISIHGGQATTYNKGFHGVPKKDLVAALVTAFESTRLKIAASLELGGILAQEALRLEARIKPNGNTEIAADWRDRDHDDLVLSLACALWWANRNQHAYTEADLADLPQPKRRW